MPDIPVVVLGGGGVGKSCLTIQYIQGHFVDKYDATIEDVYRKPIDIDNIPAMLTIVDTAGQDAFGAMRDQYLKKGQGFILVYSITDAESFEHLKRIYAQLRRVKGDQTVPCVVVGNKIDEVNYRAVSFEDGKQFAAQAKCPFLEVTAKNRKMTEDVFEVLVRTIRNGGDIPDQSSVQPKPPTQQQTHVEDAVGPTDKPIVNSGAKAAAGGDTAHRYTQRQQPLRSAAPPPAAVKKKKKSKCTVL